MKEETKITRKRPKASRTREGEGTGSNPEKGFSHIWDVIRTPAMHGTRPPTHVRTTLRCHPVALPPPRRPARYKCHNEPRSAGGWRAGGQAAGRVAAAQQLRGTLASARRGCHGCHSCPGAGSTHSRSRVVFVRAASPSRASGPPCFGFNVLLLRLLLPFFFLSSSSFSFSSSISSFFFFFSSFQMVRWFFFFF